MFFVSCLFIIFFGKLLSRWCATEVDSNGIMTEGKFGICDANCSQEEQPASPGSSIGKCQRVQNYKSKKN
jgi:hypothetical protein